MQHEHLLVTTTCDDEERARTLARSAVEARTAACAQVVGPLTSTYWWDGKVTESKEWMVVFKTTAERFPDLESHVKVHHTYEVPELVATPVTGGSSAYLDWITQETRR
ncbi:divalent-cation tolerance protein CutA [Thermasporomyces composti]|jgi:periplasmic divalent cation tolerance protein|uniref:Periplasmic divalent cation tolerance protein n=1 Tax=Thermasporomyces composti TaxID=696763 RepID=A0A3D9V4P1_THECX|nr:divalent-cation tolerance protein CutA [Thermasporomyces composti]REF36429.1 periplasmic divalent cation tolerance protein [Thermasporomyces composti]